MAGGYYYVGLFFLISVLSSVYAWYEIDFDCTDENCLLLYGANESETHTWEESRSFCEGRGYMLAAITSEDIQKRINNWSWSSEVSDVWIGGRRDTDNTWRYLNGTDINPLNTHGTDNGNCIHIRLDELEKYVIDECGESNGNAKRVCQYRKPQGGSCNHSIEFSDMCYAPAAQQGTWFDAAGNCSSKYKGDVIYTNIENETLITKLKEKLSDNAQIWLGINRKPWKWIAAKNTSTRVNYFDWKEKAGSWEPSEGMDCLVINGEERKWINDNCTTGLSYFLCMQDLLATSAAPNNEPTTDTITANSINTHQDPLATTPDPDGGPKDNMIIYIVSGVVAGVVVIVIIIVVVVVIKRKQKQNDQSSSRVNYDQNGQSSNGIYENSEVPPTNEMTTNQDLESGYSEMSFDRAADDEMAEDTIAPYGEYKSPTAPAPNKTKNRISGFFSGAVTRIQSMRKGPENDDGFDENAVYAKPMKKKKMKKKPSVLPPKPTNIAKKKEKANIDTETEGDNPEIGHMKGPEGDYYAMPLKKK